MNKIDFSVIVCNFNYGQFLGEAIESCLAQIYPADRFEIIVVDDGSTDNSLDVIERYSAHPQIRVVAQSNQGQSAAFCRGIEVAMGTYVCFLDSDDRFHPKKLSSVNRRIRELEIPEDDLFLCHDLDIVDEANGSSFSKTWFELLALRRFGPIAAIDLITQEFAFSIPCGQVMSRNLANRIAKSLPTWEWRRGADGVFGHAALLCTASVHYLDEVLSTYRVHGSNHVADIANGQLGFKNKHAVNAQRWPKLLHFLENLIDVLELDPKERAPRLAYIRRLEREVRHVSIARRLSLPTFACYVFPAADTAHLVETLDACVSQTHPKTEVVLFRHGHDDEPQLSHRFSGLRTEMLEDAGVMSARYLARAYFSDRSDYFCFVADGEVPDPMFAERHLHHHRYAALCGVTASDIRFVDARSALLHSGVFRTSGVWQRLPQFLGPFSIPLTQWPFPPLGACVLRRSRLLDCFFQRLMETDSPDFEPFAPWLLLQFVQHTAGSVRINEALVNIRLADAKDASYARVLDPAMLFGADYDPELEETAEFFFDLYCRDSRMNRGLPGQWGNRFLHWILQQPIENARARLHAIATRYQQTAVLEQLEAAAPKPA